MVGCPFTAELIREGNVRRSRLMSDNYGYLGSHILSVVEPV